MLANALSILAGFLIAVIVMLGDPRSLYRGNWRIASAHQREIRHALNRAALLFCIYLVVIAFIFAASLLEAYTSATICSRWMKHIALSAGGTALFWSFALPLVIRKAQLNRLDEEVQDRKRQSSYRRQKALTPPALPTDTGTVFYQPPHCLARFAPIESASPARRLPDEAVKAHVRPRPAVAKQPRSFPQNGRIRPAKANDGSRCLHRPGARPRDAHIQRRKRFDDPG